MDTPTIPAPEDSRHVPLAELAARPVNSGPIARILGESADDQRVPVAAFASSI